MDKPAVASVSRLDRNINGNREGNTVYKHISIPIDAPAITKSAFKIISRNIAEQIAGSNQFSLFFILSPP
jgi:hypothetical protein